VAMLKKITINDIARAAEVSKTAVSFAFNNPHKLPDRTVKKILQIAEEMGYKPDPLARSFQNKRTGSIGLLVPQSIMHVMVNPFFHYLIEGIGLSLEEGGQSLLLVPPYKGSTTEAIANAVVDGFLTVGLETYHEGMKALLQRQIPFVMIDSDPEPGIPCVNIDDKRGAYESMKFLLESGHREIAIVAFFNPAEGDYKLYRGVLQRRINSYQQALAEFGLTMESPGISLHETEITKNAGRQLLKKLYESGSMPSAIISMSDTVALGILEACEQYNISVPGDLSVVGFDDIPLSLYARPALTTVHQPIIEKGKLAAQLLLNLLSGEKIEQEHYYLSTNLVKRDSVGPLE
jgi:DNA-binding LacI/PurR family transcriptional regulator